MKIADFFKKFGQGALIGAAMIIPGVSGGTIAVLLNIYDKIIGAISDIRKDFKNSFLFLLPVILGAVAAVCAMYFPLKFALDKAPLPTVLLFAGLMLGSLPKLLKDGAKHGFKAINALSVILPLAIVTGICFVPNLGDVNLSTDMNVGGYFLLVLMGMLASCALVVPGVSGSMLMLIFGYYKPILNSVSMLTQNFGHYALVLLCFAVGLIVGFFSIAKLMKFLLNKLPRGTNWAIIGFVIGSIPAILIAFDYANAPINAIQIASGVILCLAGAIGTFTLTSFLESKAAKNREAVSMPQPDCNEENDKP